MSKYTTEVRFIVESSAGLTESAGFDDIDSIILRAIPKVFNFQFPIFDEDYRVPLCSKILKHYYTREIGLETVGLWKLKLSARLNEIMPYYNQLYKSELLEFNPLYDVDYTREYDRTGGRKDNTTENINNSGSIVAKDEGTTTTTESANTSNNTSNNSSGNSIGWDKYSDTPQNGLAGVENGAYLTNARNQTNNGSYTEQKTDSGTVTANKKVEVDDTKNTTTKSDTKKTGSSDVNTTEKYLEKISGKMGSTSYTKLIKEYRQNFLNIDMMIINDLSDLFFGLW